MVDHLVFLEDRAQVQRIRRCGLEDAGTRTVALTADALEALEGSGLPHEPVSAFADLHPLALAEERLNVEILCLAQEIEDFIGQRYSHARLEGPGFLSGQGYTIQLTAAALVGRAHLMRETIRMLSPRRVSVFEGRIDPILQGDGYRRNPWLDLVREFCEGCGIKWEAIALPGDLRPTDSGPWRATSGLCQKGMRFLHRIRSSHLDLPIVRDGLSGLRLLLADGPGFDWEPVFRALRSVPGVERFSLKGSFGDKREWTFSYQPELRRPGQYRGCRPRLGSLEGDPAEGQTLGNLFDDWLRQRVTPPQLEVLGMNLFTVLIPHLKSVAPISLGIARQTDRTARWAIERVRPHAVCFSAMTSLAAKRLAFHARLQGIPVICYQHGGGYGTHLLASYEQNELAHADFFLTYGAGIQPRSHSILPVRSRCVPVGSSRIAWGMVHANGHPFRKGRAIQVLWVAEYSTRNTYGSPFLVEDTRRYLLQRRCLQRLTNAPGLKVTYRPHPTISEWDGTSRWLKRARLQSIRTDLVHPLDQLIRSADIVITDTSSGTVWNEVLALQKPLVLYCDPLQTRLAPQVAASLEKACHWRKTEEALLDTVEKLAQEGRRFLQGLDRKDASVFVRDYVLHLDREGCAQRVVQFLNTLCR